jgi:hypothetical protein
MSSTMEMPQSDLAVRLVHAFDIRLDFASRLVFGPVSGGAKQGYVPLSSGIIRGPRLNGRVLDHSGADWRPSAPTAWSRPTPTTCSRRTTARLSTFRIAATYTTRSPAPRAGVLPLHAVLPRAHRQTRLAQSHRDRGRRRASYRA